MSEVNDLEGPDPDDYVPSPCVRKCGLDRAGRYCIGCLRTLEEITGWGTMTADQKRAVRAALKRRRPGRF